MKTIMLIGESHTISSIFKYAMLQELPEGYLMFKFVTSICFPDRSHSKWVRGKINVRYGKIDIKIWGGHEDLAITRSNDMLNMC